MDNQNLNEGTNIQPETAAPTEVVTKKKKVIVPIIIGAVVGVIAIVAIVAIVLLVVFSSPKRKYNKQLALGEKYVTDLDYDNAILAYEEAIKIDPKNETAYIALTDIYISLADACKEENVVQAIEYLNDGKNIATKGYTATSSDTLQKKITEIDEKLQECKELNQESLIAQLRMVNLKSSGNDNIMDILFNQRVYFDPETVWVPLYERVYEPDGTLDGYKESEYMRTSDGYMEICREYSLDGRCYVITQNEFNSAGLLVKSTEDNTWYEDNPYHDEKLLEYDEDGRLLRISSSSDWGGYSENYTTYEWDVDEPGYEYTYKEHYSDMDDDFGPSIPPYVWIGDMTKGGIYVDTWPEDYTYEVLDDGLTNIVIKEDTGWLYLERECVRLKDACEMSKGNVE